MTNTSSPKKSKSESTFTPLPDHLIEENILIRLAVKPLIRLACVSKGWSSMISSTKFTKEHLKLWYPSNDRTLIVQDDRDTVGEDKYYLSFDENYNLNKFVELGKIYPTYKFNTLNTSVVGSCNGLLCMHNEDNMRLYVWNPMTNQVRDTLGPAPRCRSDNYEIRCVGFGYVSSTDEYKIGCLMFHKKTLLSLVFSLKTGRWTQRRQRKKYYDLILAYLDNETPVSVGHTIYWISDTIEDGESYIIGLDLVEEDMVIISLIAHIPDGFAPAKLFRMQGCLTLCLIESKDGGRNVLHVRKMVKRVDEEDRFVWDKVLNLNYVGKNFVYLFDTGKCLVNSISHQSQRLVIHELEAASSSEQEQEQEEEEEEEEEEEQEQEQEQEEEQEEEEGEEQEQEQEPLDEGTVVWESVDRGNLFRYFSGAAFGYSESLISPFYPGLLGENEDS